ncbi:MAG TPA: hypothetical protein VHX19_24480 [Stellaceae bacterium]|jgi:hypothetical protein|nr:hypothetical protein [Stellaceae bacterium]
MNAAILSALSALFGSSIGAIASIGTTWLSQHYQTRMQRVSQDQARRSELFSQFIDVASKLYVDALVHELTDIAVIMPLYALKSQINLFAARATCAAAEDVVQRIVETYYEPNWDLKRRPVARNSNPDLLVAFTMACRAELAR